MKLMLIAAMGKNREIGKDNDLLWNLPVDMKFFKDTTKNSVVIMGRKNYESIPPKFRPLPHRTNIVISRNADYQAPECYVCTSLDESIALAKSLNEENVFIIGGAQIYSLALAQLDIDTIFLTHVMSEFPNADAYFPEVDLNQFSATLLHSEPAGDLNPLAFEIFRYDKKTV